MNALDYVVLFGTMLGIAAFGVWKTRGLTGLSGYLKGSGTTGWLTIGISVMATQASAITFLSVPGQGYESGLGFVQNYFGMPLALILVAAVFLPMFRRLNVYTAYEFLGRQFRHQDPPAGGGAVPFATRSGRGHHHLRARRLFFRPCSAGWLDLTIIFSGLLVIAYTVMGGNEGRSA